MVRCLAAILPALSVFWAVAVIWDAAAHAQRVDLELVLLADASGSIDDAEIRFQRQGYAAALTDPAILTVIARGPERRIAVTYVEWGDATSQDVVVGWTIVDGAQSAEAFARSLLEAPRRAFGRNAIGSALVAAHALIEANQIAGDRKVIDFSADSANNWGGIPIATARTAALADGIVINGLAILCRACSGRPIDYDLEAAFAALIIGGPASFVITADGKTRFAEAVRRKLFLEIAGMPGYPLSAVRLADRGPLIPPPLTPGTRDRANSP